jgi:peroxiredoxin
MRTMRGLVICSAMLAFGLACACASFADPPAVGSDAPDFTLPKLGGGEVTLSGFEGAKNVVLVFGRGYPYYPGGDARYFCPFSQVQAADLAHEYAKIKELGAEVVYIFPNSEDTARQFVDKVKDTYARKYGAALDSLKFAFAIDREKNATGKYDLAGDDARPATFVIDKAGKVVFAYIAKENQPNDLPKIEKIVEVLKGLA